MSDGPVLQRPTRMCYAVLVVCLRAGHASDFVAFLKVMVTGSGEGDVGEEKSGNEWWWWVGVWTREMQFF
jgi:hypothetical protein